MSCNSVINLTYEDGKEGSPSNPAKFKNQDYEELKKTWRRRGRLFMDNTFAPENRSLGDLPDLNDWEEAQVEWLRPAVNILFCTVVLLFFSYACVYIWYIWFVFCIVQEILKAQGIKEDPVFCKNGASRFDFSQGAVGKQISLVWS